MSETIETTGTVVSETPARTAQDINNEYALICSQIGDLEVKKQAIYESSANLQKQVSEINEAGKALMAKVSELDSEMAALNAAKAE